MFKLNVIGKESLKCKFYYNIFIKSKDNAMLRWQNYKKIVYLL